MRQLLILLCLAVPAAARKTSVTPEMDALLHQGIDAIYAMDFDGADAIMDKAIALQPDYPHGYLGRAANDLIRFAYGTEESDPALLKTFQVKIGAAIKVAEAYLEKHPNDPDVLFVLGSAYGISGRLAILQHEWLRAFGHGRTSMKTVRLAAKLDPELYDAQLGLGMFDYYVATIPKFAGWLAKIMLGGDRERGIREVRVAAEKGDYAKASAQFILVEIYLQDKFGARDPAEGLKYMRLIHARYPNSPMVDSAFISALYHDKRYDDALREAREYAARVESGRYPAPFRAQSRLFLGTVLWGAGDKEGALAQFKAGADSPGPRTRWMAWSRVREGQVLDALGRRGEALDAYRAAMQENAAWGYRPRIKPCLKAPCVAEKIPGEFAPD